MRLKDLVKDLKITKKVFFLGPKPQKKLHFYYSSADVCVVSSYYEFFGIVPLESMACGTPIVASKTGGLKYSVQDGVTGYLANTQDVQDFNNKIKQVLRKGKQSFTLSCTKRFIENFSWDKIINEYIEYFNYLIK